MSDSYFAERKEWSARKHELVSSYLESFTKILGGSSRGIVYYVDGFAGRGMYDDGVAGSPVRAAMYAQSLAGKDYQLYCINVEKIGRHYRDLEQHTKPYTTYVRNLRGSFGDHVEEILRHIGTRPSVFFLDPCGVKGMEMDCISPVLQRRHITEILLRVDPTILCRLAGSADSDSRGSAARRRRLTELYGLPNAVAWKEAWARERLQGLLKLYKDCLEQKMRVGDRAYVCEYPIRSIQGEIKYYLLFLTRHPLGRIVMSDIIYGREECYERDVREWQMSQSVQQLSLLPLIEPSREEIFAAQVQALKEDIWRVFRGRGASRSGVHDAMLGRWFGRISGRHLTQALKDLETDGKITDRTGPPSHRNTSFAFRR